MTPNSRPTVSPDPIWGPPCPYVSREPTHQNAKSPEQTGSGQTWGLTGVLPWLVTSGHPAHWLGTHPTRVPVCQVDGGLCLHRAANLMGHQWLEWWRELWASPLRAADCR